MLLRIYLDIDDIVLTGSENILLSFSIYNHYLERNYWVISWILEIFCTGVIINGTLESIRKLSNFYLLLGVWFKKAFQNITIFYSISYIFVLLMHTLDMKKALISSVEGYHRISHFLCFFPFPFPALFCSLILLNLKPSTMALSNTSFRFFWVRELDSM